jgi:transposase
MALETGTHSPWVSPLLRELGHEALVAHSQNVPIGDYPNHNPREFQPLLGFHIRADPAVANHDSVVFCD